MNIIEVGKQEDIFIKRNIEFSFIDQMYLDELSNIPDISNSPKLKLKLELLKMRKKKAYSEGESFWLGKNIALEVGLELTEQRKNGSKRIYRYEPWGNFEKDFIALKEFLDEGEYVGRKIRKRNPDEKGLVSNKTLLYRKDNIWLIFSKHPLLGEKYEIISKSNIDDYEVFGEPTEDFIDQSAVYDAIYKQLTNNKDYTL